MTSESDLFDAWYQREAPGVSRTLALVLGSPDLAEEAAAEAFARAWGTWPRVRTMASPVGWVYRVALNVAKTGFRQGRLERRIRERTRVVAAPAEPGSALWTAVAGLAPRARLAISLRYIADLPEAEIAELMGIARGTVAATLHAARRQLARELNDCSEVVP